MIMNTLKKYFWNIGISLSQLLNTLLGGDPDETTSSRCGKAQHKCKLCAGLCWLLRKVDERHCVKSIEADEGQNGAFHG